MVSNTDNFAPYAPVKNVRDAIIRRRDRGLPNPVTPETLQSIGIPAGNTPRTLQALKFLTLLDDEGQQTPTMEQLARASESEYQQVLVGIVQNAYQRVFAIVDPAQDNGTAISDAFRQFEPSAQREKMVTLFMGLCAEAGIVDSSARPRRSQDARRQNAVQRRTRTRSSEVTSDHEDTNPVEMTHPQNGVDYRLISAIVSQLPHQGTWTEPRRERWLGALTAAVDLMVEVVPEEAEQHSD